MATKQMDELPKELQEQLLEGSGQIFRAAFNSASKDGMDEDAALQVAWNTVKSHYEKGDDGNWHRKPDSPNQTRKSVQSGGN